MGRLKKVAEAVAVKVADVIADKIESNVKYVLTGVTSSTMGIGGKQYTIGADGLINIGRKEYELLKSMGFKISIK